MPSDRVWVGIDVSNDRLDVAVRPSAERWAIANDEQGIAGLVDRLRLLSPALIVLEATGGARTPTYGGPGRGQDPRGDR